MSPEMYSDVILDYYKHPRNKGQLAEPTTKFRESNPLCGDVIEMQLVIKGKKIEDIRFDGSGCAISQASAAMLTEHVKGKSVDFVRKLQKKDVYKLLGIDISPARVKCALLALKVLKVAVYQHLGQQLKDDPMAD